MNQQQGEGNHEYHYLIASQKLFLSAIPRLECVPILILLLTSPLTKAEEVSKAQVYISPRLGAGMMRYEYNVGLAGKNSDIQDKVQLKEELPFINLGTTLTYNRLFMDVSVQSTLMEPDINEDGEKPVGIDSTNRDYTRDTQLERQDYTLSFGYMMNNHFSIFAGYQYGDTSYDWTEKIHDKDKGDVGTVRKNNEFLTGGPFIGVATNWQTKLGTLGLSLAVADLDGKITTHRKHEEGKSTITKLHKRERTEKVSSSTTGVKVGLNWNAPPISSIPGLSYGVSLDWFSYEFDSKKGSFQDNVFGNRENELLDLEPFDVEETVYSVRFSLNYSF